jgi:hypothetical protein
MLIISVSVLILDVFLLWYVQQVSIAMLRFVLAML